MKSRYTLEQTADLTRRIRCHALQMAHRSNSSHIGSGLSIVDLLAVIYARVLNFDTENPEWVERDRFIVSKGHAAAVFYATLAEMGFFPINWLDHYCEDNQPLSGHVTSSGVPGVEFSTGGLGHGLSVGCGMALAAKRDAVSWRTFVLLGDGECNEGAIWEAALFAPHQGLDNLTVLIDYNRYQACGPVADILDLEPFSAKWEAFGWAVQEIDGHDLQQIEEVLVSVPAQLGKPTVVIAHTTKGKGVSFMEGKLEWHYRSPNDQQLAEALKEVEVVK